MDTRRQFIAALAVAPGALLAQGKKETDKAEDVAPPEDLMREHGVLNRILLIYDEGSRRLAANSDLPLDVIAGGADIIKRFIEEYHEKLEENYLFPRFEKAKTLVDLVKVLRDQHAAGRRVTDEIQRRTRAGSVKTAADRDGLASALRAFVRMYRPHEAREDTVLFPALRKIVSPGEFDALGDQFEDQEHKLFGEDGFEHMVERVAGLERRLGIYELAQFTPR